MNKKRWLEKHVSDTTPNHYLPRGSYCNCYCRYCVCSSLGCPHLVWADLLKDANIGPPRECFTCSCKHRPALTSLWNTPMEIQQQQQQQRAFVLLVLHNLTPYVHLETSPKISNSPASDTKEHNKGLARQQHSQALSKSKTSHSRRLSCNLCHFLSSSLLVLGCLFASSFINCMLAACGTHVTVQPLAIVRSFAPTAAWTPIWFWGVWINHCRP